MKLNKRLLSILLVVVMVIGMFPVAASAEDQGQTLCEVCQSAEHLTADHPVEDLPEVCGICNSAEHTTDAHPVTNSLDDEPEDLCPNCDDAQCTGCEGTDTQEEKEEESSDPVCTGDPATCQVTDCACKQPKTEEPLCDKCNATKTAEGAVKHEPTCEKVQPEALCGQCKAVRLEDGTISHEETCPTLKKDVPSQPTILCDKCGTTEKNGDGTVKHAEDCETLKPAVLCDKCGTTEKNEDGTPKHAEDCETLKPAVLCDKCNATEKNEDGTVKHADGCTAVCNCTPNGDVHQPYCNLYVEPSKDSEANITTDFGIVVSGCIPEGTEVIVSLISEEGYYAPVWEYTNGSTPVFAYDISFVTEDGLFWQPESGNDITVSIPVNRPDGSTVGILHVHDDMADTIGMYGDYRVQNGVLVFAIDSFSEFYGYVVENAYYREDGMVFSNAAPIIPTALIQTPLSVISESTTFNSIAHAYKGAALASSSDNKEGSIVLDKNVTQPDKNQERYVLTLESYATGTQGSVVQVPTPSDIVLVLDESGSMNDCIECNHEIDANMPRESVTTKGNLLDKSKESNDVLFVGHKVHGANIWDYKTYMIIYPVDGSVRTVEYCEKHKGWYSTNQDCATKHDTDKCAEWIPFTKSGQTPTNNKSNGKWTSQVQFYCVCDHDTERVDALRNALDGFVTELYNDSVGEDGIANTKDDVENRLAIVGYGNNSRYYAIPDVVTETNLAGKTVDVMDAARTGYISEATAYAKNAFRDIRNVNEKNLVHTAIDRIKSSEATETHSGVLAAEKIFIENPISADEDRNRVMILFTDGAPGSGYNNYGPNTGRDDWTNPGISSSYRIKNTYGATVYTVGLFPGADAVGTYNYDPKADGQHNEGFFKNANCVLQLISSNYLNAISVSNKGTKNPDLEGNGYYLSTETEEGLYQIFDALSNVAKPGETTVTLGKDTVVKDYVTDYFYIPDNSNGKAIVTAWTESYAGNNADGTKKWTKDAGTDSTEESGPLTVEVVDRLVKVTNFDYATNYVAMNKTSSGADDPRGKRLVVQIELLPNPDFLGGDFIWTNEENSGIYSGDDPVAVFPRPDVNVSAKPIFPNPDAKDIYVSQQALLPNLANIGNFTRNDVNYSLDGINNAYVDIIYTLTDEDGNVISYKIPAGTDKDSLTDHGWELDENETTHPRLTEDQTYKVDIDVISTNNDSNKVSKSDDAEIKVYKPVITFNDTAIELGETADYADNGGAVVWKHGETEADSEVMGEAPTLEYDYTPPADAFKKEQNVQVKVTSKSNGTNVPADMDVTVHTTFIREACDCYEDCPHKEQSEFTVPDLNGTWVNFVVHVKSFDLTITKKFPTGADYSIDQGQTFVFTIEGPNGYTKRVVIEGQGSVTIKGLSVGDYTITEDTGWSWRYECDDAVQEVLAQNVRNGAASVTFTNTRTNNQWLDGNAHAENIFGKLTN